MIRQVIVVALLTAVAAVTTPIQAQSAECATTPGTLQNIIDAAADGGDVTNPKVKLLDAAAEGYVVIDLAGQCFTDQGLIEVTSRHGLWIRAVVATGTSWQVADSSYITMTEFDAPDATLSSVRTNTLRIEDLTVAVVTASEATDLMAAKLDVSGPVLFERLSRVERDRSFVRNSAMDTVTISGAVDGFTFENTELSAAPIVSCEPCTALRLKGLTYPIAIHAPEIVAVPDIAVGTGDHAVVELTATDADGDVVTFTLGANTPEFITVVSDATGTQLVLDPGVGDAGVYESIVLTASDGLVTSAITVTVIVEAGGSAGWTTVGYFGCSNTVRAVDGYHGVGGEKLWAGIGDATTHPYGGNDLATSTDFASEAWAWLSEQLATNPPDLIWWEMCVKHGKFGPEPTEDEIFQATVVLQHIQVLAPGIPIHVSDLNEYDGVVCSRLGRQGPIADDLLADLIGAIDGAERGPDMSTLTPDTVERDNCHQNWDGQLNDGALLLTWFG